MTVISSFLDKKKANGAYLTLDDGESAKIVLLKEIKTIVKAGFNGDEAEFLRLVCDVETVDGIKTKTFDNKTQKFVKELVEKKIGVGSSFVLTRRGTMTKTHYEITNVETGVLAALSE